MKALVLQFPGSNCDDDVRFALTTSGFHAEIRWHDAVRSVSAFDLVVVPGGFSYGDYLRAGAMAARSQSLKLVREYAGNGGLVLGICNGFQILCESGLLPGALGRNEKGRFVAKDVNLAVENPETPWTSAYRSKTQVSLPIAHGDGRYLADPGVLAALHQNKQIAFRYADENPNGSVEGIAGITNLQGNVLGLMPHPERATDLGSRHGQHLWESVTQFLKGRT
jgi:phosphoribosylformylglycinamidine synthase